MGSNTYYPTNKEKAAKEGTTASASAAAAPGTIVQTGDLGVTNNSGTVSNAEIAADPYGKNAQGSTGLTVSFRQRGDDTQKRVGGDTRVRNDSNSGTAGVGGATMGTMSDAMGVGNSTQAQPSVTDNASWEATRQPVDLNSVRMNLMNMLNKPQQQGQ